ncbi:MAG: hypothetical protein EBU08_09205 [Micrococcales bacterium]|nr:hypothetical protein [Micrococcales bacterium]
MKNRNKFRPTFRATVSVDLYSNSTDSKFDAFASRIAGTNVRLVDSDAGEYVYETTAAGLPIVIERWNTRLGAGMDDCTISVQSA